MRHWRKELKEFSIGRSARTVVYLAFASPFVFGANDSLSTEQLLKILIKNQSVPLDTKSAEIGCAIHTSAGDIRTLGDYLAHLSASLVPGNGGNQVESSCRKNGRQTDCEVWFTTGGGTETPWRYGIQFRLDRQDRLVPDSIRCPGAS